MSKKGLRLNEVFENILTYNRLRMILGRFNVLKIEYSGGTKKAVKRQKH